MCDRFNPVRDVSRICVRMSGEPDFRAFKSGSPPFLPVHCTGHTVTRLSARRTGLISSPSFHRYPQAAACSLPSGTPWLRTSIRASADPGLQTLVAGPKRKAPPVFRSDGARWDVRFEQTISSSQTPRRRGNVALFGLAIARKIAPSSRSHLGAKLRDQRWAGFRRCC